MFKKITSYFIPAGKQDLPELYRKYNLVVSIIFITAFFDLNYAFITILIGMPEGTYTMLTAAFSHLALLAFVKKRVPLLLVTNLYVLVGCLAVMVCIYYSGGFNSPVLPWLATSPIVALLMAGRKTGIAWMLINFLSVVIFSLMSKNNYDFPVHFNPAWSNLFYTNCYTGLVLIIFLVALVFENGKNTALQKLAANNVLLAEEKRKTALYEVSQNIHDNVGQTLSLVKLNLHLMQRQTGQNTSPKFLDAIQLLDKAINDLRNISHNLNSENNLDFDLVDAIKNELNTLAKIDNYHIDFNLSGQQKKSNVQAELVLFRITQEAMHNIIKHAHAKSITANVRYEPNLLTLIIQDDGIGIDYTKLLNDGQGVNNMRNRTKLIGGELEIDSQVNKGTSITVKLPI